MVQKILLFLPTRTANLDESAHTESTQSLLVPALNHKENVFARKTFLKKKRNTKPQRLGNPIQFPEKQNISDFR